MTPRRDAPAGRGGDPGAAPGRLGLLRRSGTAAPAVAGVCLAIVAGAWLRATTPASAGDLRPRPDALEYEAGASSLAHGRGYWLALPDGSHPPRYPIGFSLLLVPAIWILGDHPGVGIVVVQAMAAAGIALAAASTRRAGGSALAAALLLASSPLHARWSRAVMADVPAATLLTALALGGLVLVEWRSRASRWLWLGVALGLACGVRPVVGVVAAPLALVAVRRGAGWWRAPLALAGGVACGVLVLAAESAWRTGGGPGDGYRHWVPDTAFFAARYFVDPPANGGREPNVPFYLRVLAGLGAAYPWPVAVLALGGIGLAIRRRGAAGRLVVVALGTTAGVVAVQSGFFWQWDRFLLPVVPLVVAVAALPLGRDAPWPVRAGAVLLVAWALAIAWTSPATYEPPDRPTGETARLAAVALHLEPNAALLAPSNPLLAARLLQGADRVFVPLGIDEHRFAVMWHRLQPLRPPDPTSHALRAPIARVQDVDAGLTTVDTLLAEGRPVYLLPAGGHDAKDVVAALSPKLATRFGARPVPAFPHLLRIGPATPGGTTRQ